VWIYSRNTGHAGCTKTFEGETDCVHIILSHLRCGLCTSGDVEETCALFKKLLECGYALVRGRMELGPPALHKD
jgi:pentatricopeptide repeat protein